MTTKELAFATSTICAPTGGTRGSPVDPLLCVVDASRARGLPLGKARLRPHTPAADSAERRTT
jgi:hypothetical protein